MLTPHLSELRLINFRCFSSRKLEFSSEQTIIYGKNGAGKTSLLEAIYYSCYATSYRAGKRDEMLGKAGEDAFIKLSIHNSTIESIQTISIGFNKEKSLIKIDGCVTKNRKEALELIKPILLQHDDIEIISGYPEASRHFLQQISYLAGDRQSNENFFKLRAILKRRKALLETNFPNPEEINLWSQKLCLLSAEIRSYNKKIVSELESAIKTLCPFLKISLIYKINDLCDTPNFSNPILNKELALKRNLIGAQLDHLEVELDNQNAKKFASRGEQRILAFLLKTASCLLLLEKSSSLIILLIDDFFAELDHDNKILAFNLLGKIPCQQIITSPLTQEQPLGKNSSIIHLQNP